ncbi:MAG: 16S rRNA (uracil(1498)-N(3))-methyltransferase [Oscillospiraceae bacterium]|nr:16S rRNA (uracil(1498)-N(3))-methyltransferase [Oscillospiraceae bacterium]
MPRFCVAGSNIFGGVAYIGAEDADHFKALRIANGEIITVCDGDGNDYSCRVTSVTKDGAEAEIISQEPSRSEPTVECTVFAALSKGDKLDHVVQKSVELGASRIVIFPSKRCVVKLDGAQLVKKVARLCKIAASAAGQSERGIIPVVTAMPSYAAAVKEAAKAELPIFCYEEERALSIKQALEARPNVKSVSVFTGPEGGFEPEEAQAAVDAGMISVSLGPRILRCETAPLVALCGVMLFLGQM